MKLNITRPLIIFDLETTGLDLVRDRIIQISYIKLMPDGEEIRQNLLINPDKTIPQDVVELTGISNDDVADAPKFKEVAQRMNEEMSGCDFAGYNSNHFDIPMLAEEFLRAGIDFDFSKCRLIDVQTIFHKMERRNLAAAYKFSCGRTYRVLMGELDMYAPGVQEEPERVLENDMDFLAEFSKQNENVDFAGRIVWKPLLGADGKPLLDNNGKERKFEAFNFGKYKGRSVADVLRVDPGYYSWMMAGDFTFNTKQVLTRIRLKGFNK